MRKVFSKLLNQDVWFQGEDDLLVITRKEVELIKNLPNDDKKDAMVAKKVFKGSKIVKQEKLL